MDVVNKAQNVKRNDAALLGVKWLASLTNIAFSSYDGTFLKSKFSGSFTVAYATYSYCDVGLRLV